MSLDTPVWKTLTAVVAVSPSPSAEAIQAISLIMDELCMVDVRDIRAVAAWVRSTYGEPSND